MRAGLILLALAAASAAPSGTRFLHYSDVREVLAQFPEAPPEAAWDGWIRGLDRGVRARVQRGAEDSVTNLLLYGTSFTSLPRLSGPHDDAGPRIAALAAALAGVPTTERLRTAQRVLNARGASAAQVGKTLAANLARFAAEQAAYQEKLNAAAGAGLGEKLMIRSTLYAQRGLSSDTSLLPNWAIEDTLGVLQEKGAAPARIRHIAVIGPGLDFADKRDGFDFYPVQSIQPFAVLEAAVRLGHADARVTAFDINPAVLAHVSGMGRAAAYRLELPRDSAARWDPPGIAYWEKFGTAIGTPAKPATAPAGLLTRAVVVRPEMAARLSARDLNIVAQTTDDESFDLVVATNILVYYDRLSQAVALANVARMLAPGGVFVCNTVLPAQRPASLEFLGRRSLTYSTANDYGDDFVVYRKRK